MKERKSLIDKVFLSKYKKTFFITYLIAFSIGHTIALALLVTPIFNMAMINNHNQTEEIKTQAALDALPYIIFVSIITQLIIMLLVFIPILLRRFKKKHNIYLIHEIKKYFKEKKL